jgi:hypothetical protein
MDQVIDLPKPDESAPVLRHCLVCERCRDCGYTHVGIDCPDPNPDFDGTCLCDESVRTVA